MKIKVLIISILLTATLLSSETDPSNKQPPYFDHNAIQQLTMSMNLTIQSGVKGNLDPGYFNRVFTNSENGISYYSGALGHKPKWYSKTPLYGKYIFSMHTEIELDQARTNIISSKNPVFQLVEYLKIEKVGTGIRFHPIQEPGITLSTKQGYDILKSNGDFRSINMQLKTNEPVLDFEKYWRRL